MRTLRPGEIKISRTNRTMGAPAYVFERADPKARLFPVVIGYAVKQERIRTTGSGHRWKVYDGDWDHKNPYGQPIGYAKSLPAAAQMAADNKDDPLKPRDSWTAPKTKNTNRSI
jgi:hypothetical protein